MNPRVRSNVFDFDVPHILRAVDDLNCDPDGEEDCTTKIQPEVGPNTLIEFPVGDFYFDEPIDAPHDEFGIKGCGPEITTFDFEDVLIETRDEPTHVLVGKFDSESDGTVLSGTLDDSVLRDIDAPDATVDVTEDGKLTRINLNVEDSENS